MTTDQKLMKLRSLMKDRGIDAYFVQSSDFHQSEYLAPHFAERSWLTGFTGSAGLAVVTKDKAACWADGRYTVQAKKQLAGTEFELMNWGQPGVPTPLEWLKEELPENGTLAYYGAYLPQSTYTRWQEALKKKSITFKEDEDLVGEIWDERPAMPTSEAFLLDVDYAGKSAEDKLKELRDKLAEKDADAMLLASLDDIAWLFNIRGRDIESNPVLFSYALIQKDEATLYVDPQKLSDEIRKTLADEGISVKGYKDIFADLKALPEETCLFLDPDRVNRELYNAIPEAVKTVTGTNITTEMKGIKNKTEEAMQRVAYAIDALALTRFMYWLHKNIEVDKKEINEWEASERLLKFRQQAESFLEPSFTTIAAYGPNAAMMHYAPTPDDNAVIKPEGFFLFDSGGQYYEGTTDITRTQQMGELTDDMKLSYTYTMKSSLALLMGRFLEGTTGSKLDGIARYPLWQIGSDYKCGTGHGVGFVLNVHEGPHRLGFAPNKVAMKEGMVVTVEPGVYKEGEYGIRIENVVIVKEDIKNDSGQFLRFDLLDFIPMDTRPILTEHLTDAEIEWLNVYQKACYDSLKDKLTTEEAEWLKDFCKPLER